MNIERRSRIRQPVAAPPLGITERHMRRLLGEVRRRGDRTVVHALRGVPSNREIEEEIRSQEVEILSRGVPRLRAGGDRQGDGPAVDDRGQHESNMHSRNPAQSVQRKGVGLPPDSLLRCAASMKA